MSAGYIDPSITPAGPSQARVLAAIRARGLTLHRVHAEGRTLRLTGLNVHITVCDLGALSLSDLTPPTSREVTQHLRA